MTHCPVCSSPLSGSQTVCPACGSSLLLPHLSAGTTLAGRYVLGEVLGQGGFGITYAAQDRVLRRPVAVKEFFPDGSTRLATQLNPPTSLGGLGFQEAKERFISEARTLGQFAHPGIVQIYDVLEDNGTAYLVMEKLEGETLGRRIERLGRLDERGVMEVARAAAGALETVHAAGLLHRDLKPDNLFLTTDGRTVLIDFGSARGFVQNKTVRHTRLVTPGYAPLEQYASSAKLGPYTDLYALGATLFHALTGSQPPSATDRATGVALPSLPRGTSKQLSNLISRALEMKVADRPASVGEWLRALEGRTPASAAPVGPSAPQVPGPVPPQPEPARRPRPPAPPPPFPPPPPGTPFPSASNVANGCGAGCLSFFLVLFIGIAIGLGPLAAPLAIGVSFFVAARAFRR
ncbi:MAG: protein kinase [Meiothermus sp.]|nr:protein kinase [Meiothermus sp.]